MRQRTSEGDKVSHKPALSLFLGHFGGFRRNGDDGIARLSTQDLHVICGRRAARLKSCGVDLGKVRAKTLDGGQVVADAAEIGTQHVVSNDGPEAVRHDDDAVVSVALVQIMESVDGFGSDHAAHRDIGRRATEVARGVAEIGLQESRVDDEVEAEHSEGERRAPR